MASIAVNASGYHGQPGSSGYDGGSGADGGNGFDGQPGTCARPVTLSLRFADDESGGVAVVGETTGGQMAHHSVASHLLGESVLSVAARGGNGGNGGTSRSFAVVSPGMYPLCSYAGRGGRGGNGWPGRDGDDATRTFRGTDGHQGGRGGNGGRGGRGGDAGAGGPVVVTVPLTDTDLLSAWGMPRVRVGAMSSSPPLSPRPQCS